MTDAAFHPLRPTGPGTPGGPELPAAAPAAPPMPSFIDRGGVEDGAVVFGNWKGEADKPAPPPPAPLPPGGRVGYAIMGLGRLALEEILPAFAACKAARPVALVSGSPEKARAVAAQYGIAAEGIYGYDEVRRLSENPEVQAVYIATPNGMHRDNVLAVAAAGKHVLCEKPMANTSAEAREMVEACRLAGVRLMIAYRCQYEPFNREAIRLVRSGELGRLRILEATNTQVQGPADQWRLKAPLAGGGALPDIGLYCLNSARAVLGEEPVEVFARIVNPEGDGRYATVEETVVFMLRFPSGVIAQCATSYGAHESRDLRLRMEGGWIDLENAFAYRGQRMRVARRKGPNEAVEELRLGAKNQFALEIDHLAECILAGREPHTPGEEGLQDHLLMEALYRSAREGMPVAIPRVEGIDAFRGPGPG
jgi:predicted dehydrogenase